MNNTDIASVLKAFFDESQVPALFAGAGISAQAGCKMWVPMLQNLANRIDSQDAPTATLMRKHIAANRLELAADLFLQSTEITPQEALGWIAEAIGTPDPKSIQDLACLPFKFAITTNYDQSLHDAYASQHGTNALDAHTFDSLLRNAPFIANKYYVARLHGRLEVPETIVLGSSQYADLLREESYYRSFLFYALTRAQLLFIGFSFLDPGIAHVLKVIRSEYPSNVKNPHLALLPEDATPAIVDEIRRCNINIRRYSGHDELWKAINSVCKTYKKSHLTSTRKKTVVDESFDFAKRYMASCYARTRLGPRMAPLTFSVIEGFVSYAIRNKASTLDELTEGLAGNLKISLDDAKNHVLAALNELKNEKLCAWDSGNSKSKATWIGPKDDGYTTDIEYLVEQIDHRFSIRTSKKLSENEKTFVSNLLKFIVLRRGWDLGASYASGNVPPTIDIAELMTQVSGWEQQSKNANLRYLQESIEDLMLHPQLNESEILADLGRISFACEMVFRSPRDSLLHKLILPQKIYLDANVLMPALAEGHPYQPLYQNAIQRLVEASQRSQTEIKIEVLWGFLNEVISHRQRALDEISELGQEYERYILSDISLYGLENINVFIGAYINYCKSTKNEITFNNYLKRFAPYKNEEELEKWLGAKGISVIGRTSILLPQADKGPLIHLLETAFSEQLKTGVKTSILIGHDATQLAVLLADMKNSIRSIFVTADQRLRNAIEASNYSSLTGAMISHVGLAQLIDLLVGMKPEYAGYSHMMWIAKGSSETDRVRKHLSWIALNEYDAAMTLGMDHVIEDYAEDIISDLEKVGITHLPAETPDKARTARHIFGTYENKFMQRMREEADKLRERLDRES